MKQGRTLQELAKEIERQSAAKRDYKAPTSLLQVVPADNVVDGVFVHVGDKANLKPTENFHNQLGTWAKIPAAYYDRMLKEAPGLLAENANHWLHKQKETRLVRALDGNARAFMSNRYRTIDNSLIAQAAFDTLLQQGSGLKLASCEITEKRLFIKAVSERIEAKIRGQAVRAGVCISNSEIGLGSVKVEMLIDILICDNGAIMPEAGMRRYHIGPHAAEAENAYEVFSDEALKADDKALMLKLRDVIAAGFDDARFKKLAEGLNITAGNQITKEPQDAVESVVEVYSLPEAAQGGILKMLAEGKDYTQWGLSNAVTAYAQDKSLDYEQATNLERIGGEILVMPPQDWKALAAAA